MALSFDEAVAVTGATAGKVICRKSVLPVKLTGAQRTQLVTAVTNIGAWPGQASHVEAVHFERSGPADVYMMTTGLIVLNDATAALAALKAGTVSEIVGQV